MRNRGYCKMDKHRFWKPIIFMSLARNFVWLLMAGLILLTVPDRMSCDGRGVKLNEQGGAMILDTLHRRGIR